MVKDERVLSNLALFKQQIKELSKDIKSEEPTIQENTSITPDVQQYIVGNITIIKQHLELSGINSGRLPKDISNSSWGGSYSTNIKNTVVSYVQKIVQYVFTGNLYQTVSSLGVEVFSQFDKNSHTLVINSIKITCNRKKRNAQALNYNSFVLDYENSAYTFISDTDKKFNQQNLIRVIEILEPVISFVNGRASVINGNSLKKTDIYAIEFPVFESMESILTRVLEKSV